MENSSKALLIAGGMLLAIMTISVFILGYTHLTALAQAELDAELRAEKDEFNKPFLAFNKNVMYGTDVVSALNMAISNNKMNRVSYGEDLYVDIGFKLTSEDIGDKVYNYKVDPETLITTSTVRRNETTYGPIKVGNTYKLSSNLGLLTEFLKTANINEMTENVTKYAEGGKTPIEYTITYSGIANFKRKTFKCAKTEFNEYGNVSYMEFIEVNN